MCNNVYKVTNGSYKGVKTRLVSKHSITLVSGECQLKRSATNLIPTASTPKPDENKTCK